MNDIKEIRTIIRRSMTRHICMQLPLVPGLADYILAFVTPADGRDAAIYASGFYELCQHVPRSIKLACRGGDLEVVKMLTLGHSLTIKERNRGVFEAIYGRHPEVTKYMMETFHADNRWISIRGLAAGSDTVEPDSPEALIGACIGGSLAHVKALFKRHSYIYPARSEAMQAACRYGRLPIVKYLEEYSPADCRAWRKACKSGDLATVEHLLPTDISWLSTGVVAAAKHGHLAIAKMLHDKMYTFKSDLNLTMIYAVVRGHLDVVIWALPGAYNRDYQSLILLATQHGRLHIIKHLATIAPISPDVARTCRVNAENAGFLRVATWFRRREAAGVVSAAHKVARVE